MSEKGVPPSPTPPFWGAGNPPPSLKKICADHLSPAPKGGAPPDGPPSGVPPGAADCCASPPQPVVMHGVNNRVDAYMELFLRHPLSIRRYYRQFDY